MDPVILYVFRGWQPYLDLSVRQAKASNPGSRVVHITSAGSRVANGAELMPDTDCWSLAGRFAKSYRHMSTNPESFELFCFQRWMVALEAMTRLGLDQAVLMDGDVLLWSDLRPVFAAYAHYGLTWTEPDQPGTVFVAKREALQELCEFMLWHYESEEGLGRLRAELADRAANGLPEAITDMSVLRYFRQDHPGEVGDNGQVVGGARFDHNMMESDGFEMSCGLKRFEWRADGPYARAVGSGDLVRFHSMHFVGRSKGYMGLFARRRNLTQAAKLAYTPQWVRARVPAAIRRVRYLASRVGAGR